MSIFQIVSVLFAIIMLYVVSVHRKKKSLSPVEASFWFSSWGLFIVIAVFPDLLSDISGFLSFTRVFDLLIVIALMVLSSVLFLSYFKQKELSKKLEDAVRRDAIAQVDKK